LPAAAQTHEHMQMGAAPQSGDKRQPVMFPGELRNHELANMRDHLSTLAQIQAALSKNAIDEAANLAEKRLGMSSFELHGAHEVAKYMPEGMQQIGSEMHRAASRFALEATNAGATGDIRPALAALATLTQQCVACHSAYRLQ
jgi:cytochrome c556